MLAVDTCAKARLSACRARRLTRASAGARSKNISFWTPNVARAEPRVEAHHQVCHLWLFNTVVVKANATAALVLSLALMGA